MERPLDVKSDRLCDQIRARDFPKESLRHDRRIKAAAIADPLSDFFSAESFSDVMIPVQLWGSEAGAMALSPNQENLGSFCVCCTCFSESECVKACRRVHITDAEFSS
jgi:hypothetical protein